MHTWKKTSSALLLYLQLLPFIRRIVYLKSLEDLSQFVNLEKVEPSHARWCELKFLSCFRPVLYPISDSPWVSPTQVVPKKSGITVVQNDKGEDVSTRLTTGWRVCIDYRRLNVVTRKDHFPLPFIDQIEIDVEDQEKTTFTCPFGTYAYRRMPLLMQCTRNFPKMHVKHFQSCSERCIEKDLVLNWEKSFHGTQGIVLGHIISKQGIEVDKAKVELIVKLPSPTNVKGVRQFLGHRFYRRFIKDFSKLARPLCELLVKDAKFIWDDRCQRRVVLGQREDGKPYVIYYASKTLNEAQRNYTTTEKELLAVVFALDKFRAYLVGSFIVVFTDHSALKYLLTKQDAKARLIRWISCFKSSISISKTRKEGVSHVGGSCSWYAHIANYLVTGEVPSEWKAQDKKHFFAKIHAYYWEEPFLFKYCADR
ncbi:Retrovirus-related Pol polyprotein from transposon 17.6 [Vitis vinifera]|uniref:Retrovirus-related Pol polyprotein from transposon 17.6 n=1 Tax=Vitis vinifera TaxID=29760 RepID=A0A438GY83_VITVI|nr:Retrovirus-related Pol polyprotein from transposon 17.6 [Vitis vinifera]